MSNNLVCRKCSGPHLTIKCGKEKKKINFELPFEKKKTLHKKNFRKNNGETFCVKLSNLPDDVTVSEMTELIRPWGAIGRVNFGKSTDVSCYVDFYNRDEAEYFVKALDRTPFDNLMMSVEML